MIVDLRVESIFFLNAIVPFFVIGKSKITKNLISEENAKRKVDKNTEIIIEN